MNQLLSLKNLKPMSFIMYIRHVVGIQKIFAEKYDYIGNDVILKFFDEMMNQLKILKSIPQMKDVLSVYIKNDNRLMAVDNSLEFMTFHRSKGLEFDSVFIPNLNEGIVPRCIAKFECNIEEERRLLYVAMTRAKDELFLYAIKNEEGYAPPSRFIKEMYY